LVEVIHHGDGVEATAISLDGLPPDGVEQPIRRNPWIGEVRDLVAKSGHDALLFSIRRPTPSRPIPALLTPADPALSAVSTHSEPTKDSHLPAKDWLRCSTTTVPNGRAAAPATRLRLREAVPAQEIEHNPSMAQLQLRCHRLTQCIGERVFAGCFD